MRDILDEIKTARTVDEVIAILEKHGCLADYVDRETKAAMATIYCKVCNN